MVSEETLKKMNMFVDRLLNELELVEKENHINKPVKSHEQNLLHTQKEALKKNTLQWAYEGLSMM